LAAILGERPVWAFAAQPTLGPAPVASPRRSAARLNAENRAIDKLREAAVRALDVERGSAEPLPVRQRALPVRGRAEPPSSGDMNAVMVAIARPTDRYTSEISEPADPHRAHTTSGARGADGAGDPGH
jgi:hypothetical protein